MKDFIYSIKDVFNPVSGCLFHYKVKGYYIASYQRGYKWKSNSAYDQVPVLLLDVYEAFIKNQIAKTNQEYYLQYITVKKNQNNLFEVIDGQQRLTTLTLMFSILANYFNQDNIVSYNHEYLVKYARYNNVNIFDNILHLIQTNCDAETLNEQDKFYMLKASLTMKHFFNILKADNEENFAAFLYFFKNNVKLILNIEDEHTTAEEVFANLNDNKVPLTNAYLIKGLLLTKASRLKSNNNFKKPFKEVIDQRAIMGRMWDEMNAWFSKHDISLFFFGTYHNGMEKMLELVNFQSYNDITSVISKFKSSFNTQEEKYDNPFILFNTYHQNIITEEDAVKCLNQIKHIYKRLKNWYYDNQFYNLIGYKQVVSNFKSKSSKGFINNINELLQKNSNKEVLDDLQNFLLDKLPKNDKVFDTLGYQKPNQTFHLLLAINVFPQNEINKGNAGNFRDYRFDFFSFKKEEWSLEHIFPQQLNSKNFSIKDDKKWIIDKINKKISSINEKENSVTVNEYKNLIERINSDEEVKPEDIDFVLEDIEDPNFLGNMALLSKSLNTALSNGFFNTKRKILLRKINLGSFVPKHTLDVFSKMLETVGESKFDDSLTVWSEIDIKAHKEHIRKAKNLIFEKYSAK